MTIQIALDPATNDIVKLDSGGIARVKEGQYTVQLVKNRLKTQLGEWLLDPTVGWLNFDVFERNPDLFNIELKARQIILSTHGVQAIESLSTELVSRTLLLSFVATTIYGGIEVTIPWSL